MHLFELTRTLVDIESITGAEKECVRFLSEYLWRDFDVELQPVSPDRANILAVRGNPEIVLSTHVDTVPPFIPAAEDEHFIYGRGSCDAKGIVASQITAAERLLSGGVKDFALLFLVGEEVTSDGAAAANSAPRGAKYIINGEPTENRMASGTKGILRVDITCKGRMAHSAYPQLGESAIDKLLDVLADLRGIPLSHDPVLGPATMNIGIISGGRAANVIPDEARAQVLFRLVNNSPDLRDRVDRILGGRCEYEFARHTPAMLMEPVPGFDSEPVAFTTDLPNLTRWGRPILLGPGSITVAHTDHERVAKTDLLHAVELYCQLVRQLKSREH